MSPESVLSSYKKNVKNGKGKRLKMANFKFTVTMAYITKRNNTAVLMEYIIAGPKYIRTRLTSSVTLFIKSPVVFFLKKANDKD